MSFKTSVLALIKDLYYGGIEIMNESKPVISEGWRDLTIAERGKLCDIFCNTNDNNFSLIKYLFVCISSFLFVKSIVNFRMVLDNLYDSRRLVSLLFIVFSGVILLGSLVLLFSKTESMEKRALRSGKPMIIDGVLMEKDLKKGIVTVSVTLNGNTEMAKLKAYDTVFATVDVGDNIRVVCYEPFAQNTMRVLPVNFEV